MGKRKNKFSSNARGYAPSGYAGLYFMAVLVGGVLIYFPEEKKQDDSYPLNLAGWLLLIFGLAKLTRELRPLLDKYFPLPKVKSIEQNGVFRMVKNVFTALMVLSIIFLILEIYTMRNTFGGVKVATLAALVAVPVWLLALFFMSRLFPGIYADGDRRYKIVLRSLIFFTSISALGVPFINYEFADTRIQCDSYRVVNTYTTTSKSNDIYHITVRTGKGETESFVVKEPVYKDAKRTGMVNICTRIGYFGLKYIEEYK